MNSNKEIDEFFNKLQFYFDNQEYKKAAEIVLSNIELGKNYLNNNEAFQYCNAYMALDKYSKIIENNSEAYFQCGHACLELKKYDEALEYLNKCIELNANNALAYNSRGKVYQNLSFFMECHEAINDYTKAIELDKNLILAYQNRAFLYYCMEEYKNAIEDYSEAIKLNPKDSYFYYRIGECNKYLNKYENSIENYTKAIELASGYFYYYSERAYSYRQLKKYNEAKLDYFKAMELEPDNIDLYKGLGLCYEGIGEFENAIENYNKIIELDSNDFYTYLNRGDCYKELNRLEEAENDYDKFTTNEHKGEVLYTTLGLSYEAINRYEDAIRVYTKALTLDNNSNASLWRADLYFDLKEYEKAIKDYTIFLEIYGNEITGMSAYKFRGLSYMKLKKYEEARNDFNTWLKLYYDDPFEDEETTKKEILEHLKFLDKKQKISNVISKSLRFDIFKRDDFACQYCGGRVPNVVLEIDAIKPFGKYGINDISNFITSCKDCNMGKGNKEITDNHLTQQQLKKINKKKLEIESCFEYKKEVLKLDNTIIENINNILSENDFGTLTEHGEKEIIKSINKYGLDEFIDCLYAAIEYGKDKNDIRKTIIEYTNRIIHARIKEKNKPYLKDFYYIKKVLENRFYDMPKNYIIRLDRILSTGFDSEDLKNVAKTCKNISTFDHYVKDILSNMGYEV